MMTLRMRKADITKTPRHPQFCFSRFSRTKRDGTGTGKNVAKRLLAASSLVALAACSDADVASRNLSRAADQFGVTRRVVFYNGITGDYILTVEGLCSLGNGDKPRNLSVTCKTGPASFKKHFLGLSDNVTYFAEQIEAKSVSTYHYRVIFKPSVIIPDVDFRG